MVSEMRQQQSEYLAPYRWSMAENLVQHSGSQYFSAIILVKPHCFRYLAGVTQECREPVLLRIAEEVDLSHSLLARIVLERHLSHTCYHGENRECYEIKSSTILLQQCLLL